MSPGELSACGVPGPHVGPSRRCQWLMSLLVVSLATLSLASSKADADPVDPSATVPSYAAGADCASVLRRFGMTPTGYESGLRAHPVCDHQGRSVGYDDYLARMGLR